MKLRAIIENEMKPSLDTIGRFPIDLYAEDPDLYTFFSEPPPNITPIPPNEAKIVHVGEPKEDDLIEVIAQMSLENYIRNCIEYDNEPYYVLEQVKQHMGPEFAKIAKKEGFNAIAESFTEIAEVEQEHEKRYRTLLENVKKKKVFKKEKAVNWKCRNCGYVHEGKEAPKLCPACKHPQAYYEVLCENY